jgi:hypothetical protein
LIVAAGCGGGGSGRPHVDTVEVSGKVFFNGQPLPGGQVTFTAAEVQFVSSAVIDEKGDYKIDGPVGHEAKISIDNRILFPSSSKYAQARKSGAGRPPGEEAPRIKGTYKKIPTKYHSPDTSGLTYTVTSGPQTYNIQLKD